MIGEAKVSAPKLHVTCFEISVRAGITRIEVHCSVTKLFVLLQEFLVSCARLVTLPGYVPPCPPPPAPVGLST